MKIVMICKKKEIMIMTMCNVNYEYIVILLGIILLGTDGKSQN